MRRPRKQRLVSEINITPFTDVILVLLVIFMITTPLISESNIKVMLPKAKSGTPAQAHKQEQVSITINNECLTYLDNKLVTKKELAAQVEKLYKDNPDLTVVLRSDRLVRFKDIMDVLDPLVELGITKLNIATTGQD